MRERVIHRGLLSGEASNGDILGEATKSVSKTLYEATRTFALDTCDREVMAWCATTGGISGEMIRDLMVESVERRFGSRRLPQPIQWLSDNDGSYRAHK